MCGILGFYACGPAHQWPDQLNQALDVVRHRGPDDSGQLRTGSAWLGHRRLSIIDLSTRGHQPMTDLTGRYSIVYNGEIFNYRELRETLRNEGVLFQSDSDTEVLLHLFIRHRENCLDMLNGFFAFAVHDLEKDELFLARDRFGIKPLFYYRDQHRLCFSSALNAIQEVGLPSEIDQQSLLLYLQLNYIPPPFTILKDHFKLKPGHYLWVRQSPDGSGLIQETEHAWYSIPYSDSELMGPQDYRLACEGLYERMQEAVRCRLISDVPVGTFLSGGIDSSIMTALASQDHGNLRTFSIGFSDDPLFDESAFSIEVARHCGTKHTVFPINNDDLVHAFPDMIAKMDEPFADSSALAVFLLSRLTKNEVTVAISGDGGDELFAGYNKHRAEWMVRNRPFIAKGVGALSSMLGFMQGSRQSKFGNRLRQFRRFAQAGSLSNSDRYWKWCTILNDDTARQLVRLKGDPDEFRSRRDLLTLQPGKGSDLNRVLLGDFDLVLPGDMLTKVDTMSMAHGLEVRVPFLDHHVVEWAFRMPASFKIDAFSQKKILKDTFGHLLPGSVFHRPKKGFEIPLQRWLKTSMRVHIENLLDEQFISKQGIFNTDSVTSLKRKLDSSQPGDSPATLWSLVVFQSWYQRHFRKLVA